MQRRKSAEAQRKAGEDRKNLHALASPSRAAADGSRGRSPHPRNGSAGASAYRFKSEPEIKRQTAPGIYIVKRHRRPQAVVIRVEKLVVHK